MPTSSTPTSVSARQNPACATSRTSRATFATWRTASTYSTASNGHPASMATGWRRSPVLHPSATTEATTTPSHGQAPYHGCGAVTPNSKEVMGRTKQRRCNAHILAVSMADPRTGAIVGFIGSFLTYASVCESRFPTYAFVCQEGPMPATTPRAAAKAATRDALLDAALAEIAERGLDAPSLDAICARAGYTRGAFYVHFKDRDALVAAVVQRAMDRFLDAMIAHGDRAHDLEETITRFATVVGASSD